MYRNIGAVAALTSMKVLKVLGPEQDENPPESYICQIWVLLLCLFSSSTIVIVILKYKKSGVVNHHIHT